MKFDTVSIVSVDTANNVLAADQDKLITGFRYRERHVRVEGEFGPWRIVKGGSGQLLHVEVPFASGRMQGSGKAVDLTGVVMKIELALKLIPVPETPDQKHLVFDIEDALERANSKEGAHALRIVDPSGKIPSLKLNVVREVVPTCLSKHVDKVSFVFASVATKTTGGLEMPHNAWRYVELGDGSAYLAIMGCETAITDTTMDPKLIKPKLDRIFALSKHAVQNRIILPYLNNSFKPKAHFKYNPKSKVIANSKPIKLPKMEHGIWWVDPTINSITFTLVPGHLRCVVKTVSKMPLWTTFNCDLTMNMPLKVVNHKVQFAVDPKPGVTHSVGLPPGLDVLVGWFVNWIVGFFHEPIVALLSNISKRMQSLNSPSVQPVSWLGLPDFRVDKSGLGDWLWLGEAQDLEPGHVERKATIEMAQ
ncbi:TULIP family P47-like protein [Yoonia sp. F2084L]|uniref:TULIP family P47-like protein n=1 Tax=Yoonia sp. F2084L TaxID=2926419 RepID=UPI001FF2E939|nr:TULIP family P47-like protein [Yoonia sp. F2084L]MCK0094995.1 TULIP family P47-like protein [Yoonia sp. F2084L]